MDVGAVNMRNDARSVVDACAEMRRRSAPDPMWAPRLMARCERSTNLLSQPPGRAVVDAILVALPWSYTRYLFP